PEDYPAAILIRGAGDFSGPARLTKGIGIDGTYNRKDATGGCDLWLEDRGIELSDADVTRTPRIGVDYAGVEWAGKPYRFLWTERAGNYLAGKRSRGKLEQKQARDRI